MTIWTYSELRFVFTHSVWNIWLQTVCKGISNLFPSTNIPQFDCIILTCWYNYLLIRGKFSTSNLVLMGWANNTQNISSVSCWPNVYFFKMRGNEKVFTSAQTQIVYRVWARFKSKLLLSWNIPETDCWIIRAWNTLFGIWKKTTRVYGIIMT